MTTVLPQLVVMWFQAFVGWMAEFYINSNGEITDSNLSVVIKVGFNHFKIISMLLPSPIAQTPGPTRSPSMAISGMSDSQVTLINSKRGTKRIYLCIPHSRVRSTTTPSIAPSALLQGHKALGTFSTPNFVPSIVTLLINCSSVSSSPFVLCSGCNSTN